LVTIIIVKTAQKGLKIGSLVEVSQLQSLTISKPGLKTAIACVAQHCPSLDYRSTTQFSIY